MAFVRINSSDRKVMPQKIAKTASTAMSVGQVLITSSGQLTPAANTSVANIVGLSMKVIAATDSDYASETALEVEQIDLDAVYEADVYGTLTTAMIGNSYDLSNSAGSSGATHVNVGGTSYKQVKVVGFISASKALVQFNYMMKY
jgi:hypothetical protein